MRFLFLINLLLSTLISQINIRGQATLGLGNSKNNFNYSEHRLDLNLDWNQWSGWLELEYANPPELGRDFIGLRKFRLEYLNNNTTLKFGDLYEFWGRGLILNMVDDQSIDLDNGITGALYNWSNNVLGFEILAGKQHVWRLSNQAPNFNDRVPNYKIKNDIYGGRTLFSYEALSGSLQLLKIIEDHFDPALNTNKDIDHELMGFDINYFGNVFDEDGNIRVIKVLWKSRRKMLKVTKINQFGNEETTLEDENFKIDKDKGEKSKILWANEWWEGHKIGGSSVQGDDRAIYVRMRPRPIQFRNMENPSKCSPGIVGTIYQTNDNTSVSLMDRMKHLSWFVLVLLTIGFVGTSCSEKRGCTDQYSDNFDPEASQDDDTCIPTTDKFEGEYFGQGQDEDGNQYENIRVCITDSTATEPLSILIYIEQFDLPENTLDGRIENTWDIVIDNQTINAADPIQYVGSGSLSGRVLTLDLTRSWYDEVLDSTLFRSANFYALKEIGEDAGCGQ